MGPSIEILRKALESGSPIALPIALLGGLVMGLNPCCLALYPAAAATCCAKDAETERRPAVEALLFVFGTAVSTAVLGTIAAVAGRTMTALGGWVTYAVAIVPLVMGVQFLGVVHLPMPRGASAIRRRGGLGAFLTGLLLSLVMSPCGTPALAAILAYAAYQGSLAFGAALLFAYGLGNGLPLLAAGSLAGGISARLARRGWGRWTQRAAGVAMLGVGSFLLWSNR